MGVKQSEGAGTFGTIELVELAELCERDFRAFLILVRFRTLFSLSSDGLSVPLSSTVPSGLMLCFADVGETGDGVFMRSGEAGTVASEL